jgi:hypothetical protein
VQVGKGRDVGKNKYIYIFLTVCPVLGFFSV